MKFRTTSQLPRMGIDDPLPQQSLVEISLPVDMEGESPRYSSRAMTVGLLKDNLLSSFQDQLEQKYGLKDGDRSIRLSDVKNKMESTLSADTVFSGRKTFVDTVAYQQPKEIDALGNNELVAKVHVVEMSRDYGNFLSPKTTFVDSDPQNTTPNTAYDSENFMKWQFDQDGRDSEQFILDPYSNQRALPVFAKHTGNLVVYGWLADNGNVAAQEAWVGLFGKVNIGNQDTQEKKWVALQIQPWIIGTKSQALQYVGFNVPVKKGMQLKIMTGFPVNVRNSGFQDPSYNTLTLLSNQPCTFIGYILRND